MKKCVILFAVLIVTLIIAIYIERAHDHLPAEDVALQNQAPTVLQGAVDLNSD